MTSSPDNNNATTTTTAADDTSSSSSSTKTTTKVKSKVIYSTTNNTTFHTFLGAITLSIFILTWISSLASPFLLYYAVSNQCYGATLVLVLLCTLAYAPWSNRLSMPSMFRWFISEFHPRYYTSCSLTFQSKDDDDNVPRETDEKVFYAIHPHGIFCLGLSLLFAHPCFAKVKLCFSPALFVTPFFRIFSRTIGNPGYADKQSMIGYMKKGTCMALPPGGFEEATISTTVKDRVYIKKRMGFVKLCLQHKYKKIVPVYAFGEKDTFWNLQGFWKFRIGTLNGMGIPAILPFGRSWVFPLLPKRSKVGLHVVAGVPVELPILDREPTKEDVAFWHGKYVEALETLIRNGHRHGSNSYNGDGEEKETQLLNSVEVW